MLSMAFWTTSLDRFRLLRREWHDPPDRRRRPLRPFVHEGGLPCADKLVVLSSLESRPLVDGGSIHALAE